MMAALDVEKSADHVRWLTDHTPSRISGMGQDREAAEYICKKIEEYGLESKILEFEAYNSHPGTSKVKIVAPVQKEISSIACCHIESTPVGGADYEVVYLGSGGEEDYVGKDVAGKAVLVEVSYAPATPEKAMLASEHHAAAMICMNWGTAEHELICNRGLKAVWGNPTPESFGKIPQIVGISITRKDGEYLKELCLSGEKVVLHMDVQSQREWQTLPQPMGILRGTEEPEKFLLVSAHLDAWCPGVTCNATGDGTMLEMMRVFGQFRDKIKRSIYFIYWNGHEIAEAAGSTWFQDYFYEDIRNNCIGYINIDSTGMRGAEKYGTDASRELSDYAYEMIRDVLDEDVDVAYLAKTGDQSFFGVGVPSIAGRISYSPEVVKQQNGATLGYWNHTCEDSIDKMDVDNLEKDNRVDLGVIYGLANAAEAESGINAINEMSKFLSVLERVPLQTSEVMPAQPYITLRVRGGSNRYSMVVPDSCEALISKHTVPGETPEKIIVDLQSAVQREKLHASFEFAVEKPFYPSFLLNDNLEEICRLRHIFEEVTGEELKLVCSDGVSDNNHWSTIGGIPSVCFGPGGKGLHQSDEWVSTEQMENVLEVYLRFFLEDEE